MQKTDKIKSVKIYRRGEDAEKFTATQEDFNRREEEAKTKARAEMEKLLAPKIVEVEKNFPGFEKTADGIYFKITKEGSGEKCGEGKNVRTEYKGYLVNGQVFDGSAKLLKGGHEPLDFITAAKQMIPGFDLAVQDMKVGEVRTVVLPPDLAYGANGIPGVIPENSFLAFDIELVSAQ